MKPFKARFSDGVLEPLEKTNLEEGVEVFIEIKEVLSGAGPESEFMNSAGSWAGTLDFDQFLQDMRDDRKRMGREVVYPSERRM
ncbi:MAG: DUF104 domain-containing protein [SAR202 cluster bacterium]|nr:DUF104 domain-containing protein [SAR202 cluster bacterium]